MLLYIYGKGKLFCQNTFTTRKNPWKQRVLWSPKATQSWASPRCSIIWAPAAAAQMLHPLLHALRTSLFFLKVVQKENASLQDSHQARNSGENLRTFSSQGNLGKRGFLPPSRTKNSSQGKFSSAKLWLSRFLKLSGLQTWRTHLFVQDLCSWLWPQRCMTHLHQYILTTTHIEHVCLGSTIFLTFLRNTYPQFLKKFQSVWMQIAQECEEMACFYVSSRHSFCVKLCTPLAFCKFCFGCFVWLSLHETQKSNQTNVHSTLSTGLWIQFQFTAVTRQAQ